MKIRALVLVFWPWGMACFGQEPLRPERDFQQLVEELLPNQSDNLSEEVLDNLYQLFQRPLDVNRATAEELSGLYVLTPPQVQALLAHRQQAGPLASLYELQAVPGFDVPTIRRLLPFVSIQAPDLQQYGRQLLLIRYDRTLETRRGYRPNRNGLVPYQGSPYRLFARYQYTSGRGLSAGFTAEKDAGEPLRADFVSGHIRLQNKGRLKDLLIGDYQQQWGQGVVMAGGFYLGKGSETVLTTRRGHLGSRPYTSATENGFLRGLAATVALTRALDLSLLGSRTYRDANLTSDSTVSSLQTSGLHRTAAERADRHSLLQTDVGGLLRYRLPAGYIGVGGLWNRFDKTLKRAGQPYNRYEFSGRNNLLLTLLYSYGWRNMNFFGEVARSASGGLGGLSGVVASFSRAWNASLLLRHYARDFHGFYGNSFGENARNINETGLYAGASYQPSRQWLWAGYVDFFRFPERKYLVDVPSAGWGGLLRVQFQPRKTLRLVAQVFSEQKARNIPERLSKTNFVSPVHRSGFLLSYDHDLSLKLSLQTRLLGSHFIYRGFAPSQGWALVQDARWRFRGGQLGGRLAYFNTDDYDSRLYVYEADVPYTFSIPAYFDEGVRAYLMGEYELTRQLSLWFRFSRTRLFNQKTIGSGYDETAVPYRTDVKLELVGRF